MMDEAKFSQFMATFLAEAAIADAFPSIVGREINVNRWESFPVLAYWVEDGGIANGGSDGETANEITYVFLVATKMADGERQDVAIGKLIKVVRDLADTINMSSESVDIVVDRWSSDNNAGDSEGNKVWASFAVLLRYDTASGAY